MGDFKLLLGLNEICSVLGFYTAWLLKLQDNPSVPSFKSQADGTYRLSQKVSNKLAFIYAV